MSVVILFQVALFLGAPWGDLAMGGRFPGRFPTHMRVAALVQAILLTVLGIVVLIHARIVLPEFFSVSEIGIWVVVVIMTISLIMNLATPSRWERMIWAPIVSALLVCSLVVAIS